MKIVLFNDYRPGVVRDDGLVDVTNVVGDDLRGQDAIEAMINSWDELTPIIASGLPGKVIPLSEVTLRAPVPKPGNLLGMRVNFREGTDTGGPIRAFAVSPGAILDPGGTTVFPEFEFISCRHEAELVCVIGKHASKVTEAEAMGYVFGYTAGVDIGIFHKDDWGPFGKSCDGFKPIGPWIVTKDEIADPQALQVRLTIDGVLRQDYNTSDIAHPVAECVAWFSSFMTLVPGDIIFMGTNHQQVGPLQDGETVEMSIERVGAFTFHIRDPLHRTWPKEVFADLAARAIAEKDSVGKR